METCAQWFVEASQRQQDSGLLGSQPVTPPHRILLFNCMKVSCAIWLDKGMPPGNSSFCSHKLQKHMLLQSC